MCAESDAGHIQSANVESLSQDAEVVATGYGELFQTLTLCV